MLRVAVGLDKILIGVEELNHALLLICNTLNVCREGVVRHESSDAGNLNELGRLLAVIAQGAVAELSNGKCCALGIDADAFCSCHLHGLDLDQFLALEVAACCGSEATDEDHQQAEACDRTPHR